MDNIIAEVIVEGKRIQRGHWFISYDLNICRRYPRWTKLLFLPSKRKVGMVR